MEPTFAHADIIARIPIASRKLIAWADGKVLLAAGKTEGAGSGVHRRFTKGEVEIAAILYGLDRWSLPLKTLKGIAAWIREIQKVQKRLKIRDDHHAEETLRIDSYLRDRETDASIRAMPRDKAQEVYDLPYNFDESMQLLSDVDRHWLTLWLTYDRARNPRWESGEHVVLWLAVSDDGAFQGKIDSEFTQHRNETDLPHPDVDSYLTLRLSKIFQRLYAEAE